MEQIEGMTLAADEELSHGLEDNWQDQKADSEEEKQMGYSSLASAFYPAASGNTYGHRTARICKFTPHHMAGLLSADACARSFQNPSRGASANYCIGNDGRIVCGCDESIAAGTSSNYYNDNQAITVEVANSAAGGDWPISQAAWNSLVNLAVDVCRRYGFRLNYTGNSSGSLTEHRMFSATACPGPYLHARMNDLARQVNAILDGTQSAPSAPQASGGSSSDTVNAPTSSDLKIIPVHYALRKKNGAWWGDVTNFNNTDNNGYAGAPYTQHDLLTAWVDRGTLSYKVHTIEDGWLSAVNRSDKNDTVNGCAGISGHTIDGVQFYYITPSGEDYRQAWYRSQTTKRSGWLPVCCDNGTTYTNYDGWAGMYGEPLDRLQLCVCTRNPF